MSTLLSSPASAATVSAFSSASEIVRAVFDAASDSSSLLASRHPVQVAGEEHVIPKFLLLGQRGGGRPIRLAIFAGLDGGAPETTAALARLLLQYELSPALARDFALFAYPVVNLRAFEAAAGSRAQFERRYAADGADEDIQFFKRELREWAFDGLITLRTEALATGFHARVRSEVIGREVATPALEAIGRKLPVEQPPVTLRPDDRFARLADHAHGKLTSPAGEHPYPFEIDAVAPTSLPVEQRIVGLFLIVQEILRNYRQFISHAQHL